MRGRNAVLSQGASEGRRPPPKNNVFVFAAVTQGRAQMLQGSSPGSCSRAGSPGSGTAEFSSF